MVKTHTLMGDGVAGIKSVGDPEAEWEDCLLRGEAGLCRIDALGVRS